MRSSGNVDISNDGLSLVRLAQSSKLYVVVARHNGRRIAFSADLSAFLRSKGLEDSIKIGNASLQFRQPRYLHLKSADSFAALVPFDSDNLLDALSLSYIAHSEEFRQEIKMLAESSN